jgi:hypothetical protein
MRDPTTTTSSRPSCVPVVGRASCAGDEVAASATASATQPERDVFEFSSETAMETPVVKTQSQSNRPIADSGLRGARSRDGE